MNSSLRSQASLEIVCGQQASEITREVQKALGRVCGEIPLAGKVTLHVPEETRQLVRPVGTNPLGYYKLRIMLIDDVTEEFALKVINMIALRMNSDTNTKGWIIHVP